MLHYLIPAPSVLLTESGKSCIKAMFKKMKLLQSTVQINIMCSLHLHRIHSLSNPAIPFDNGRHSESFGSQSETVPNNISALVSRISKIVQ